MGLFYTEITAGVTICGPRIRDGSLNEEGDMSGEVRGDAREIKKGAWRPLFVKYFKSLQQLLVVDVHGDFEAKANVAVFRSFPFHDYISSCVNVDDYRHRAGHLFLDTF